MSVASSNPPSSVAEPKPPFDWLAAASPAGQSLGLRAVDAGAPIAVATGSDAVSLLGVNTTLDEDGKTIRATVPGSASFRNGRLCVVELRQIPGNWAPTISEVAFAGDVHIAGAIPSGTKLHVKGSLFVDGDVESADLRCDHDLFTQGAVAGKENLVATQGSIWAKYINNARMESGGDIHARLAIVQSYLFCRGKVNVDQGAIVGGAVTANGGVICRTLGHATGPTTHVEVGVDEFFRRQVPALVAAVEAQRTQAGRIEQTVQPLMSNQRRLTPSQKEKATELLCEAKMLAEAADNQTSQIRKLHEAAMAASLCEVQVREALHPGVILSFPGLQARVTTVVHGPVKIILHVAGRERRIVLVDLATGKSRGLGAEPVPDEIAKSLARLTNRENQRAASSAWTPRHSDNAKVQFAPRAMHGAA